MRRRLWDLFVSIVIFGLLWQMVGRGTAIDRLTAELEAAQAERVRLVAAAGQTHRDLANARDEVARLRSRPDPVCPPVVTRPAPRPLPLFDTSFRRFR